MSDFEFIFLSHMLTNLIYVKVQSLIALPKTQFVASL